MRKVVVGEVKFMAMLFDLLNFFGQEFDIKVIYICIQTSIVLVVMFIDGFYYMSSKI